jgi:pyruvate kinase
MPWPGLVRALTPGEVLYLADGRIRLRTTAIRADTGELDAQVEVGGTVASGRA